MTDTQVLNWTTNVRKRNLKATVEKEKKPHHFLDFLFLATDREKMMRRSNQEMDALLHEMASQISDDENGKTTAQADSGRDEYRKENHGGHFSLEYDRNITPMYREDSRGTHATSNAPSLHRKEYASTRQQSAGVKFTYPPPPPLEHFHSNYYRPYDIHHRPPIVPPQTPQNTNDIFRRGKRINYHKKIINPTVNSGIRAVTPSNAPSKIIPLRSCEDLQNERQRLFEMRERMVIQDHTLNGMINTPQGSFDESILGHTPINDDMFEHYMIPYSEDNDDDDERMRTLLSNEMQQHLTSSRLVPRNGHADMPYDESDEDHLMELILQNNSMV